MAQAWTLAVVAIVLIAVAALVMGIYNRLVRGRLLVREAFSGIDVQLKRRHELIPNLVSVVRGYRDFEQSVIENVARLRSEAMSQLTVAQKEQDENRLSGALGQLFAVAEAYPELKANENFLDLQRQLTDIEDDLQRARRYYNGTVRDYNTRAQSFPDNLVASWFGFRSEPFFELESLSERAAPTVKLSESSDS